MAKTEKITLEIEATGAAAAQKQLEGTRRSVEGLRDAATSAQKSMSGGGKGGWIGGLKQQLGEESQFGGLMKMIRGGGAIAAVKMFGDSIAKVTGSVVEMRDALQFGYSGKGAGLEQFAKVMRDIPLIGGLYQGGEHIRELITGEGMRIKQQEIANAAAGSGQDYFKKMNEAGRREAAQFVLKQASAHRALGLIGQGGERQTENAIRAQMQDEIEAIRFASKEAGDARIKADREQFEKLEASKKGLTGSELAQVTQQQNSIRRLQQQELAAESARAAAQEDTARKKALANFQESRRQYVEAEKQKTDEIARMQGQAVEADLAAQGKMLAATEKRIAREYTEELNAINRVEAERMRGAVDDADKQRIAADMAKMRQTAASNRDAATTALGKVRDERVREAGMAWRDLEMAGLRRAAGKGDRTAEEQLARMELSRGFEQEIEAARRLSQDEAAGPIVQAMAKQRMQNLRQQQGKELEQFTMGWRPELVGFQSGALMKGTAAAFMERAATDQGNDQKRMADNSDKQVGLLEKIAGAVANTLGVRVGIGG